MRATHAAFLLGALAGAAVATIAGSWILARQSAPANAFAAEPGATPAAVRPSTDTQPPARLATPGEGARSVEVATHPTRQVDPTVDAHAYDALVDAAAKEAIETAAGDGAITGHVRDAQGVGLAGVVVRARSSSNDSSRARSADDIGQGPPPVDDLEQYVKKTIQSYRDSRANVFETTTDADGAYRLVGLPELAWSVACYKRDWVIDAVSGNGWRVSVGSELDFVAAPVIAVQADVVLPDGSAPRSASIRCRRGSERAEDLLAWAPDARELRLTPGSFELTALSGAHAGANGTEYDLTSPAQTVELVAGAAPAPLRFVLAGRLGIRGRVRMPDDGLRGASPHVALLALGATGEGDIAALGESDKTEWIRPGGEFAFLDLDPGRYLLGVFRTWRSDCCAQAVVEVTDSIVRCELGVPPIDLASQLVVTVLGSDGHVLDGVELHLSVRTSSGSRSWGAQELRLADGRYLVPIPQEYRESYFEKPVAGQRFELQVTQSDQGTRTVELTPGQTELSVTFAVPAKLEATVAGVSGSAYEGRVFLTLESVAGEDPRFGSTTTRRERVSPDGRVAFDAVEPGSYRVRMTLAPKGEGRQSYRAETILTRPIDLAAGPNAVALAVPPLYPVTLACPESKPGTNVRLTSEDDRYGGRNVAIDADGRAVFEDIPAGHYSVYCWNPPGQMEIDVPCGVVEFAPQVMNALRVSITDPAGTLGRAGLVDGDLIVGVGSEAFASQNDFFLLYRKSEDFTLAVLRGGRRVDLHVDHLDSQKYDELGGKLTPTAR